MIQRKRKFVRRDVQLRVIFVALLVASVVLLLQFQLTLLSFGNTWELATHPIVAMDELRMTLVTRFLVCVGLSIPVSIAIAVVYSFRFAGPIYRFKKYFVEMKDGRWDIPCSLRKGDDLQDVCQSINEALDGVRGLVGRNDAILSEVRSFLSDEPAASGPERRERLVALLARIEEARAECSRRLPSPAGVSPTGGSDAGCSAKEPASADRVPVEIGA